MRRIVTLLHRDRCRNRLTPALEQLYGSGLGFPEPPPDRPYVVINFVKTMDGIISYQLPGYEYAQYISNRNQEDAFIMGLLRALSDAVLEGTTYISRFPDHTLLPARVDPTNARQFAALRQRLNKPPHPLHVFLTRSGSVLAEGPAKGSRQIPVVFRSPDLRVVVVTTEAGAKKVKRCFRGFESYQPEVFITGSDLDPARALGYLREKHGIKLVVVEGGPRLCGDLVKSRLSDEWFLTTAPQIAGNTVTDGRPTLVQEVEFTPETSPWHRLVSVKVAGDFIFERYRSIKFSRSNRRGGG